MTMNISISLEINREPLGILCWSIILLFIFPIWKYWRWKSYFDSQSTDHSRGQDSSIICLQNFVKQAEETPLCGGWRLDFFFCLKIFAMNNHWKCLKAFTCKHHLRENKIVTFLSKNFHRFPITHRKASSFLPWSHRTWRRSKGLLSCPLVSWIHSHDSFHQTFSAHRSHEPAKNTVSTQRPSLTTFLT